MATAKLRAVGGSTVVAIPPALLAELGLSAKSSVEMRVEKGSLVIEPSPRKRPRYTLEELMAGCDLTQPFSEEEREWESMVPVGNERIP